MSPYYFYLLRCRDNSLYSGITTDLTRRLQEHNSPGGKGSKYVHSRLPAELVYQEKLSSKSEALKREAEVKKWRRSKKLTLINESRMPSDDN
jgi:putative endonuclease